MKRQGKRFCACFLCLLMCAVLSVGSIPARAAETAASRYDFSTVDPLDAYDQYKKEVSTDEDRDIVEKDTEYVLAASHNEISTIPDITPINRHRYGAFLRNASEEQRYMLFNMEYSGPSVIPKNVLTIYADPGVKFKLVDRKGGLIVTEAGVNNSQKVAFYNKTVDNGHNVYYIEMNADQIDVCRQMLTFTSGSATAQPHYSFWFGTPLVEEKTVSSSMFTVSAQRPNRSSSVVSVRATGGIPTKRAWVHTVVVSQYSETNKTSISSGSLTVTTPNGTQLVSQVIPSNGSNMTFSSYPGSSNTSLAAGTYKFQLTGVRWSANTSANVTYRYMGQMTINYLAAFGV